MKLSEMTNKQLKEHIRDLTNEANIKLLDIQSQEKTTRAVKTELATLERKGIIGKKGYAVLGFSGKNKQDLIAQARELEYFQQWKGTESRAVRTASDQKKYRAFKQNNPEFKDYTYEKWRDMVETFGTMDNFVESFGYENLKQLHKEMKQNKQRVDFRKALTEVRDKIADGYTYDKETGQAVYSSKPVTREEAIDLLRKYLFEK